ncbi:MAG TPA: hypothetical protein VGS57_22915 [Thermoanaerobaculia bacterium]|jgi:mono/diheme cytochrome c family protein|nr:hypothetical protein [Thermoanaerobaculia bacterium]
MREPSRSRGLLPSRCDRAILGLLACLPLCLLALGCTQANAKESAYPAAGHVPDTRAGWNQPDPGAPYDEPKGGKTMRGTPITPRTKYCFPAETRNLFSQVDMVVGKDGRLAPFDWADTAGNIEDGPSLCLTCGRNGIRGQNTWILWGEGNEAFWGWLQEQGYGLTDFLILLDSRQRYQRFATAGLLNQPGMKPQTNPDDRILGLYLDVADGNKIILQQPPTDIDPKTHQLEQGPPPDPHHPPKPLFIPGDPKLYESVLKSLAKDGLDYTVYGYPSGIVGLRLMPNPDFFGNTPQAATARRYWDQRVVSNGNAYYQDPRIAADPSLIRPFRVSMSCGFCHIAPHPLNPPVDPERPEWANMSSTIGNQYWRASKAFANLTQQNNALYQFLASQQPGTIDTSLVSTDQINNANTITNIWAMPARLARAQLNPREQQSDWNLLIPTIEDPTQKTNPRLTPRILLDGADSVGVFGALSRVYINIGTFPEEWFRCHNAIIGFKPQRPFNVQNLISNSVFWNVGDEYRVPYLASFFTYASPSQGVPITTPMKLADALVATAPKPETAPASSGTPTYPASTTYEEASTAAAPPTSTAPVSPASPQPSPAAQPAAYTAAPPPAQSPAYPPASTYEAPPAPVAAAPPLSQSRDPQAQAVLASEAGLVPAGRKVFLQNCAVCHSSKQPQGFALHFNTEWRKQPAPPPNGPAEYTLPQTFADWEAFRGSPQFADYRRRIEAFAASNPGGEDFLLDNYMSTDIRVPITLVGTNSGRSMGTNAMKGQVWDNFSSDTYKALPAVGEVHFYNPWSGKGLDQWGNNDVYVPEGGGPGYYRPASLISIWATSPLLHNNSLGLFNNDPSVHGRLAAFDDAIDKLLWKSKRRVPNPQHADGDLRYHRPDLADGDPGFIYRSTAETSLIFAPGFIKPIVEGVLGSFWTGFLTFWLWILLGLLLVALALFAGPRWAGFVYLFIGLLIAIILAVTRIYTIYPVFWLLPLLLIGIALLIWLVLYRRSPWTWRTLVLVVAVLVLVIGVVLHLFVCGKLVGIDTAAVLAPFPEGMPVNLLWSINPEAPVTRLVGGISGLTRGLLVIHKHHLQGAEALHAFEREAALPLLRASKCPDYVLDRGHWFAEGLSNEEKQQLKAFLRTL